MSRCFPFPPPGYEKKPQSNNLDLLLKKKKEKEQKNERKDREKKEGRERKDRDRDKDRSKDKSREKKDKKEKRRDKDRKKDKDKDEKAAPFGRKDEDQEASLKVEGAAGRGQRKLEGVGGANGTERAGSAGAATHERAVACEVGIRPPGKGGGVAIAEQRRAGPASVLPEAQDHPFGGEQRRLDGSGQPAGKKSSTAAIAAIAAIAAAATADAPEQRRASSLAGVAQEGAVDGGTVQSIASDRKTDGKKKAREKEASERKGDRDREKKHKGKDRARDKEEKKREKTKGEGEPRRREADKLRDAGNLGSSPAKPPAAAAAAATTAAAERKSPAANGPLSKRDRNGFFLHEDEARANKLPRADPSSQLPLVNGIKPDSVHISFSKPTVNEEQQHKINGTVAVAAPAPIKPRPTAATAAAPPATAAEAPENGEPARKPPHPHEIQLSRLLQLPKLEEWVEPDDQEWLLGREDRLRQKPTQVAAPPGPAAGQPNVWAEAMRAEPGGVLLLPYVVPY